MNCKSTCERFKEYREWQDKVNEERAKQHKINDYVYDQKIKTLRRLKKR